MGLVSNFRKGMHTYVIIKRFLSGQPMDGRRRTDATFFSPASRSLDPSGRMLRWEKMRGASRAGWRLGVSYLLLLLLSLLLLRGISLMFPSAWELAETIISVHISAAALTLAVSVSWYGTVEYGVRLPLLVREETEEETRRWRWRWLEMPGRRWWEEEKVLPLAQGLSTMLNLGTMTRAKARRVVHVPRNYREGKGGRISILLPSSFTGADKGLEKRIISTVQRRLGFKEDLSASWELEGASPRVLLHLPPSPPPFISFEEMLPYLRAAQEMSPAVGVTGGGEALSVSLTDDSPHIAVSAGSGAGKSVLIKNVAMQFRRWGWSIVILDWKEESHEWAKGLHGVRYCTSIEQIHDMCVALGDEVETRKANPHLVRPKTLIIAEEMNITAPLLAEYWTNLRATSEPEERKVMPLRSPAMSGIMKVNFTGRQLNMCQIFVAQRFSARVTNGNADLRESFQVLFMARWKSQTLKMLAGGIKPFPRMPKEVGRWVCIIGEQTAVVQVPYVTDEEAREFALSGTECAASPFVMAAPLSAPSQEEIDIALDEPLGDRLATPSQLPVLELPPADLRKLSDMTEGLAHLGITLAVLRHAAKDTESGFPVAAGGSPNRGYTYDYEEVTNWARRRFASRAAEREARS